MAVRVRMGEKEILQAMKQSILMLMASCQESEDDDEDEEDDEGMGLASATIIYLIKCMQLKCSITAQ